MRHQDNVDAWYIELQDRLDHDRLMEVILNTAVPPARAHLLTSEEMESLAPAGTLWLGDGPHVAPPSESRGTTSTDDEPSMSEDEDEVDFGPDQSTAVVSGGLTLPTAATSNLTATIAPQQVAVAPVTAASTNPTSATAPQQIAVAPIAATHLVVPAPTSAYQLIVRAPPNPNRFASQYLRPHLSSHPPPPAQGLFAVSTNVTNVINNGAQLVGKVPHEAQPPPGSVMTMPEIMIFCPELAALSGVGVARYSQWT
ncbi:hypothetical protein LTR02_003898 [Friedmanniomyces endolithicus]|nr:hypothetical protein LTR02_003898 [Friedmanniomyces endolithicus]